MTRLSLAAFSLFCYVSTALAASTDDFVTTWKTDNTGTSNDTSITVPMVGGPYDVDWNDDGVFDDFGLSGTVTHDYLVADTNTIRIRGTYDSIRFNNGGDKEKILSLDQWGANLWLSMNAAFRGAVNLQVPATDTPDFSAVKYMSRMFFYATSANPDTSSWDTSAVWDMSSMFSNATSANPDTRSWDTSAVISMSGMFSRATSANSDTSSWDTSAVTNMSYMFAGATSANPDTSGWDTSAVTSLNYMFAGATSANPDTRSWDTSAVIIMRYMFRSATSANPDTSDWDTSAVKDMSGMFSRTTSANPDTSSWDTSSVTDMLAMFSSTTSANPDTSGWDTSAVTDMHSMFSYTTAANPDTSSWDTSAVKDMSMMFFKATSANPDTSSWDTSAVWDMRSMFSNATSANPDLSDWNTSAVTDMSFMFYGATAFDQDIGGWNVSPLTDATDMFEGVSLSPLNYDNLLTGWNAQPLQSGVTFGGGNSTFCSAEATAARSNMISSDGWEVTDAGQGCETAAYLAITKTDNIDSASPGGHTIYSIVATNQGPGNVSDAHVVDHFPEDLMCTYSSTADPGVSGNTASGAGDINDTLIMPARASATYTANCDISSEASAVLINTVTIDSVVNDPVLGDNSATDYSSLGAVSVSVFNAGLNDAWVYSVTNGQGFFINVFPDIEFVSLSWFTYDTERPPEDVTANLGDPGHRWLNALGQYSGNQAVMDISITSGGIFDTPTEVTEVKDGTIILTFSDCENGLVEYDIPSINQQGVVPIQRVVGDNIALCEAFEANIIAQRSNTKQEKDDINTTSWDAPVTVTEAPPLVEMNAGLNDAWFYSVTNGQGFFINVFPDIEQVSLSWFTYDTELPLEDVTANLGDPGHRWLNALGSYTGVQSVMDITITSGGIFDTPTVVTEVNDGTITLTFSDCENGLIEYDIPSINQQGTIPIERVVGDNIALCEALSSD